MTPSGCEKSKIQGRVLVSFGNPQFARDGYPTSFYLRADSTEDQIVALAVLFGLGLLLAIVDTVSIVVTYS